MGHCGPGTPGETCKSRALGPQNRWSKSKPTDTLVRRLTLYLTAYILTDRLHERLSGAIFFMAKASQLARNAKKAKLSEKFAEKRAALKLAGDWEGLQKLPKNSSPVRVKNRCVVTGRPRGYMRAFGLSRIMFRELAREGKIPGVKKSSW